MTTATTTITTATDAGRTSARSLAPASARFRGLAALVLALTAMLTFAAPAAAVDGPIEVLPVPLPEPDPEVALQVSPHCDPARVSAHVAVLSAPGPDGRPYTVKLDWSNQDSGDSGSSNGPEAQLPTGEGTVDVTAVVHFPEIIDLNQDFHAAQTVSSSTKTVTVECDDDPDGNPGGGDGGDGGNGGNGGGAVDPDVRSASPNFTG